MESLFSGLKVELIYAEQYSLVDYGKTGVFEYIEVFYYRIRRLCALAYISPVDFERK